MANMKSLWRAQISRPRAPLTSNRRPPSSHPQSADGAIKPPGKPGTDVAHASFAHRPSSLPTLLRRLSRCSSLRTSLCGSVCLVQSPVTTACAVFPAWETTGASLINGPQPSHLHPHSPSLGPPRVGPAPALISLLRRFPSTALGRHSGSLRGRPHSRPLLISPPPVIPHSGSVTGGCCVLSLQVSSHSVFFSLANSYCKP